MNRIGLACAIALPVFAAACNRTPEPEPMPVMLTAAEQACVDQGVAMTGADPSTVIVTPTASTKTGESIYTVNAGGMNYNCVAGMDGTVSSFTAM